MDALTTNYKLGSLFDGSGGFPLAGALCGIEPRWASEVEPYPIAVTRTRFKNMEHLGDISKINGAEIEPVDIITFGSPCQDLSVAGKRAGLKHEANGDEETTRSGLFMEAVRIIKEMREATNGEYPRFALWENVPGAFTSNKGEDFRIVLEELVKIVEPSAVMPSVPKNGWAYADSYIGDGWSLAYRVFDAQYWGVPQRRRRIHLIADFRGECAREVLFEREGVRGYFAEGRTPWQGAPADAQGSTGADDREGEGRGGAGGRGLDAVSGGFCPEQSAKTRGIGWETEKSPTLRAGVVPGVAYTLKMRAGCEGGGKGALIQEDKSATLATNNDQYLFQPVAAFCPETGGNDSSRSVAYQEELSPTLRAGFTPAAVVPICMATQQGGAEICTNDKAPTITAAAGMSGNNQPVVCFPAGTYAMQGFGDYKESDVASGLKARDYKDATDLVAEAVPIAIDRAFFNQGKNALYAPQTYEDGTCPTLVAKGPSAVCYSCDEKMGQTYTWEEQANTLAARDYKQPQAVCYQESPIRYIVRRLTPTECARLQGFADRWGDVEAVDTFTQKDYQFWLEVRNTHASINGKKVQDYTVKQMLTWYNKLQTDSAEYKMWGNGIALPPALYCMQGIVDALSKKQEEVEDDWMI